MQCEYFALEGLTDLVNTIKQVHANLNPDLRDHRPAARDVRPAHHAAAAGQRAAQGALRRQGVRHRDPAQRAPRRSAELRHAGRRLRPGLEGRARLHRVSRSEMVATHRTRCAPSRSPDHGRRYDPRFDAGRCSPASKTPASMPARRAQQRWVDGWLLRFSPGKAKRARCINAVAAGRRSASTPSSFCASRSSPKRGFADAVAHHAVHRSRPGSTPRSPTAAWVRRIDDTRVMVLRELAALGAARRARPVSVRSQRPSPRPFADWVGRAARLVGWRSASAPRRAHRVPAVPLHARSSPEDGEAMSSPPARSSSRADVAGLYDVFTAAGGARPRATPSASAAHLLAHARGAAARRVGYLQVEADNEVARGATAASASPTATRTTIARRPTAPPERRWRGQASPSRLVEAEVHVHRLHRGAARALAEVVEARTSGSPALSLANTNRSTRLVSLHACTSKQPSLQRRLVAAAA